MSPQAKKRTLIAACGLLVTVLASRVFYFQDLFFALLLFAGVFFILLLLACMVAGVWMLYEKAVTDLARWTVKQGHGALLPLRTMLLDEAPTISRTDGSASAPAHTLFYLFGNSLRPLLRSLRQVLSHFRADAERAAKHLRLLLKHSRSLLGKVKPLPQVALEAQLLSQQSSESPFR